MDWEPRTGTRAIAVAILLLRSFQHFVPMNTLKRGVASIFFALGVYRLLRAHHPRGPGMRAGGKDLFAWSFLMASAHGAGLMLVPVLMTQPIAGMTHNMAGEMLTVSSLSPSVVGLADLDTHVGHVDGGWNPCGPVIRDL
jgi:hypothetical protein